MKKIFLLIVGIVMFSSISVNAAVCTDHLTYITTQDTEAIVGSMSESPKEIYLEKGSTFEECFVADVGYKVILSNGENADSVRSGTYELKEKFDIKKAHQINKIDCEVSSDGTDVFSDPTPITKIGNIPGNSKVKASYYYGAYVYVTDGTVEGWVHDQNLIGVNKIKDQINDTDSHRSSAIEKEDTSGSKLIIICSAISLLIIIIIVTFIVIKKKAKDVN